MIEGNHDSKAAATLGVARGGMFLLVGVMCLMFVQNPELVSMGLAMAGSLGGAGALMLAPGAYFLIKNYRVVRAIRNEELNVEQVRDLVAQILIVVDQRVQSMQEFSNGLRDPNVVN